jgi:hypothetical protein
VHPEHPAPLRLPATAHRRRLSAPFRRLAATLPPAALPALAAIVALAAIMALPAIVALAAIMASCATVPKAPAPVPAAAAPPPAPPASSPWQVPAAAYGSQILYRVGVAGAEGEGSLKLTLRLASPERYQAQAVDPLGRAVWGLDVEGDRGLWLDHRGRRYCRLSGALDLAFLPLGPLSLSALPPLLLGRLPVPPADPAAVVRRGAAPAGGGGTVSGSTGDTVRGGTGDTVGGGTGDTVGGSTGDTVAYRDAAGRGWSAVLRGGQVVSWGLWQGAAAAPILSWASSGSWAVLSDRRKGVEVRWREAVREPLRALVPMTPRSDYRQDTCTGLSPSPPPV